MKMSLFAIVQKSILISNKMLYPKTTCMRSITGFIQKIATIFHGLLKGYIRFSRTTYKEYNFTDCT